MNNVKICTVLVVVFLLSSLFLPTVSLQAASNSIEAKVISLTTGSCPFDEKAQCKFIIADAYKDNKTVERVTVIDNEGRYKFSVNDRIWITKEADENYYLQLPNRSQQLLWVVAAFFVVTVLLIGRKGIRAILTLIISTGIVFFVAIPAMMANPNLFWLIGLLMVCVIMTVNILLGQGISKNTLISLLGSFITIFIVAFLSWITADFTRITGLGSEGALFLQSDPVTQNFNLAQIFQVGTLIGISGAIDDVTNAQAIIVDEQSDEEALKGLLHLYKRGMRLGSTHIVSMINTLFLAYLGVGLTTVLLFQTQALADNPLPLILSRDDFSEEILRTLMASFAVVLAIPITTILAAWMKRKGLSKKEETAIILK